ncbi:glycosyltransferase [Actinotalea sp. K2]|uniref:glycosyltransferase n=1 Tax=Actinotalea sp. K2 TaxID=2939438 RepID=UPI002017C593|nr:glycosyltransferase [Actinotalea sp. K2]MCL3862714.1 glycosyltransferase [Actinotalea sp. K2]
MTLVDLDGALVDDLGPNVEVIPVETVVPDRRWLHSRAAYLDRDGFLAWIQPVILRWALDRCESSVWVSPSSLVLADLEDVARLAHEHGTVLLPRAPGPLPPDRSEPRPEDLLGAGLFTTSLVGVGQLSRPALERWADRCAADVVGRPWLDEISTSPDHMVLHDDGLAVSAWSVGHDTVVVDGDTGVPMLRGRRVRHVDLSGFDPDRPWLLDARLTAPRVLLSRQPALARVCRDHGTQLRADASARATRPAGAVEHDPLEAQARRAYRRALDEGQNVPDPLDPADHDSFVDWLLDPLPGTSPTLTRYIHTIYLDRPDLQAAIPGVPDLHVRELLTWADRYGRDEEGYDPALIDRSLALAAPRDAGRDVTTDPHAPAGPAPEGVNVVGYLRGELGVGESARLVLTALAAAGTPHRTIAVSRNLQSRQGAAFQAGDEEGEPYDITLLCVNADMTADISALVPELLTARYRIGMWYWEVEDFPPALRSAFAHVDEVWVATDFVREAISRHTALPVRTVPPPLPVPSSSTAVSRADLGLPDGFLFLFSFDFLSGMERKNPLGLIDAFRRAFPRGAGPTLVIKTINATRKMADAERLRIRVADEPDVLLIEEYLDSERRDALTQHADCYVSLHRAEGLGLTLAEAMALGKPVVATGYSGNLDFMTPQNSFLVPWTPVPVPPGCEPYPAGSPWADPDVDAAAAALRAVADDPEAAAAVGRRAAADIRERHSAAISGHRVAARLEEIRMTRSEPEPPRASRTHGTLGALRPRRWRRDRAGQPPSR